ncbi:MAG: LytR/AlgR family response regulator transcription factor [Lachnospiraceae bacterium]
MYLVICEDEPEFAEELKKELTAIFAQKQVECRICYCKSGQEFCAVAEKEEPIDLLFMDIHLGDADGVELVKKMNKSAVKIPTVFLSSLEDRIAEGYDVNTFHFLFKSHYKEKLPALIERFLSEIHHQKTILIQQHHT